MYTYASGPRSLELSSVPPALSWKAARSGAGWRAVVVDGVPESACRSGPDSGSPPNAVAAPRSTTFSSGCGSTSLSRERDSPARRWVTGWWIAWVGLSSTAHRPSESRIQRIRRGPVETMASLVQGTSGRCPRYSRARPECGQPLPCRESRGSVSAGVFSIGTFRVSLRLRDERLARGIRPARQDRAAPRRGRFPHGRWRRSSTSALRT